MLGMAIRMATDLNLHRKSMVSGLDTEEGRARDLEVGLVTSLFDITLMADHQSRTNMAIMLYLRSIYIRANG